MGLENIQKSEKKLKKRLKTKLPKSLRKYIKRLKSELRKNLVPEEEIKKIVRDFILKYKKKDEE